MAVDETRFIRGDEARRLRLPGQTIIENPAVLDRGGIRETEEGIPSAPPIVQTTPLADGTTPAENRESAQRQAEAEIGRIPPEEGPDGRSPDPRVGAEEADTGSGSVHPEEADARREQSDPTGAREAAPARPNAPHYFVEQVHQAYYHDVIVYIEGQEVSDYLVGTLSVTMGLGSSPNKCEFKLDNAGHKFTLTPDNLQQGLFRVGGGTTRGLAAGFDYSELAKKNIFDIKSNPGYNPVDDLCGGRRFPLHHWSTVFHKNDSIRAWIHNPASDADEWIPVFTGYVVNKPISENYITGENTISVTCQDIRYLMQKMRVNTNSVLAVLPSQQSTTGADPTNTQPFTGLRIFHPQANQQFNQSFFTDLVQSSIYDNPWAALRFRDFVAALTFMNNVTQLVRNADGTVEARFNRARQQEIRALGRQISPLHQRREAGGRPLSPREQATFDRLKNEIEQNGATVGQAVSGTVQDISLGGSNAGNEEAEASAGIGAPTTPNDPPGTGDSGGAGGGQGTQGTTEIVNRRGNVPPRGAGRIGRMRPGVFPIFSSRINGDPVPTHAQVARGGSIYPPESATDVQIQSFWQNWYNLCLFGSPIRSNVQDTRFAPTGPTGRRRGGVGRGVEVEDGVLDHSINLRKYWRQQEVHEVGEKTRREGLWQTDTQAVHMILPARRAPTSDLIFEISIIGASNVQANLNWTTRLALLNDACDNVDYRFWVSGTGDLIFEFAQYDFDPRDYGRYEAVLTLDHHLLHETFDEEAGEIVTAVVANGSYTGIGNVDEGDLRRFVPRSVGVWSPNLASRHGLNVRVKQYPQIRVTSRLKKLAMLEFQKLLAAADSYSIGLAFRPWLLLNKPIFNRYRERYALIDGIRWTLPITAGAIAGHQVPTYDLTLNYSRSMDELGIPRFITGGPSQPMYFGARRGRSSIASALAQRISSFRESINNLRSSATPASIEQLEELRRSYNALLPVSQTSYNVIDASLQPSTFEDRPEGELSAASQALRAAQQQCNELISSGGSLTEDEFNRRIDECDLAFTEALIAVREAGQSTGAEQSSDGGTEPDVGRSGVRTTLDDIEDQQRPPEGPPPDDALCFPGDPEVFSSPLGRSPIRWAPRAGVVHQEVGDFPRYQGNGFGMRARFSQHKGCDLYTAFEEPVYACADGIVILSSTSRPSGDREFGFGDRIGILHKNGFVTINRHLKERFVQQGEEVRRHQQIGTIGNINGQNEGLGRGGVHLHFETGVVEGSPAFNRYVSRSGSGTRFRRGTIRRQGQTQALAPQDEQGYASFRVLSHQGPRLTVTEDQRNRFNLGFIGEEFRLSNLFLFYSPLCYAEDPFHRPEQRGNTNTTRPRTGVSLLSLRDYFEQHGLMGIPAILERRTPPVPARDGSRRRLRAPTDRRVRNSPFWRVPDPPPADASERRRDNIQGRRDTAIAGNARVAAFLAVSQDRFDEQQLLYSGSVPPEDCPPERYEEEGTPRQPGEPLPERRRITRAQAAAAYRTREGTSGEGGSS